MKNVRRNSHSHDMVFSLAGNSVRKVLILLSFVFCLPLYAVHVGSGVYNNDSINSHWEYSCDVAVRVGVSDGYLVVEYINESTFSGTGKLPNPWPTAEWAYLQTKAARNGVIIGTVNHSVAYSSNNRTYKLPLTDGLYIIYGDGKGGSQRLGDNYVFCRFQLVSGEIKDLEYTEEPPNEVQTPPKTEWFNDTSDIMHLQGILKGYDEDGKAIDIPVDIFLEPGQTFTLTPYFWARDPCNLDVSTLKDPEILWREGVISMDDWNKAKNANPPYTPNTKWEGSTPEIPDGWVTPHDPRWYDGKPYPGTTPNPTPITNVPDDIISLPDNWDDLTQDQKDAIEKGVNDYNNGSASSGGTQASNDTVKNPDSSNSDKLLSGILAENKKQTDALKDLSLDVDFDTSGIEEKIAETNDHLSEMKEEEKGFFDKIKDWLFEGDGEGEMSDREGKANADTDSRFTDAKNKVPGSNNFTEGNGYMQGWGQVSVEGDSTSEWIVVIPEWGTINADPRVNLAPFAGFGMWFRTIVMGILGYYMLRGCFERIRESLKLLMTTTAEQGGTMVSIAPLGLGVTTTSAAGLIKIGVAVLLFGGLATTLWIVYKGNPYFGYSFGLTGMSGLVYDVLSMFLPIEALVAFPVAMLSCEISIFAIGMGAGWLKKSQSII